MNPGLISMLEAEYHHCIWAGHISLFLKTYGSFRYSLEEGINLEDFTVEDLFIVFHQKWYLPLHSTCFHLTLHLTWKWTEWQN